LRSLAALAAVLVVSVLAYMPFCALVHRCGCSWPWAGADAACNVHHASGPHCPWCEHQALGAAAGLGILGGQSLLFHRLRRRGFSVAASALGAAASFVVIAPLAAALLWIPTDYPHLFRHDARTRLGLPAGPVHCVPRRGTIPP
jgi:hypothetical protein